MSNRGFTLLELILVFAIMALVIGMSVPALSSFKRERDLAAASEIAASACNYARSLAVTTGRRTRLGLDRENGRIDLLVEEDPLTDPGTFNPIQWPVGLTGTLPKGVMIEQVYYPVVRDIPEEEQAEEPKGEEGPEVISAAEAAEERKSVLVFNPDGSARDTFIYLNVGDASSVLEAPAEEQAERDLFTVAIVGAIGVTVIVPRYTEEIFEVYDTPELR
ncbi:MAG: hypothetical protein GHCLOJNM_03221 [bacterium]|nr:hypothetical protein [bacterium]